MLMLELPQPPGLMPHARQIVEAWRVDCLLKSGERKGRVGRRRSSPRSRSWSMTGRSPPPSHLHCERCPAVASRWYGGHHPIDDAEAGPVRLSFNPQLRVEFHGGELRHEHSGTTRKSAAFGGPRELTLTQKLVRGHVTERTVCSDAC
jgi:hypothetical protein